MNIISNTCVGAALMRDCLKIPYCNPFCWMTLDYESMYYLIENFKDINFDNYELYKNKNWHFYIKIDDKVRISYPHYKFGPSYKKITVKGVDVWYCKIWEYINEKYIERTKRMKLEKDVIFILATIHPCQFYTAEQVKSICELCTKKGYKLIVANDNFDFSKEFPSVKFIKTKHSEKDFNNVGFAKEIYPQIKEKLK